jgi:hypothetical protein
MGAVLTSDEARRSIHAVATPPFVSRDQRKRIQM